MIDLLLGIALVVLIVLLVLPRLGATIEELFEALW